MIFTGVHLDPAGKPVRWRVENSWVSQRTAGVRVYFVLTSLAGTFRVRTHATKGDCFRLLPSTRSFR